MSRKKKVKIEVDIEKQKLIDEICRLDSDFLKLEIDLTKFTKEELQKHIDKMKGANNVKN